MRAFHCTWTLLVLLALPVSAQQAPPAPAGPRPVGYTVFLRGSVVGHQEVTVRSDAGGLVISGQGQMADPIDVLTRKAEIHYRPDFSPASLTIDARVGGVDVTLQTDFNNGSAVTRGTQGTAPIASTDAVTPQTVILPNVLMGAHAVMARRLAGAAPGAEFRVFAGPGPSAQVSLRLGGETTEQVQTGTTTFDVHRYELTFDNAGQPIAMQLYADNVGTLIRLNMPGQGLEFVRDDIAGSMARTHVVSNPGDEAVVIPAAGFNLGATLTRPAGVSGRLPAVVLVGGAESDDRDGLIYGVPVLAQLAGAAARSGVLAVRYDERGFGQSGGRHESATIGDLAEDVRAIVKWLGDRRDIDPKRIAVLGHGEGAWIALLAASREKQIAALISIDAPSTTGAEIALEQQQHALDRLKVSPEERQQKIELQKRIQTAVLTGKGWENVPPSVRQQVDTPWAQSVLAFNPAAVVEDVRQPMLFIHAELDRQIPVSHVERLADIARKEGKTKSVEVLTVRGVNYLLVPAITGEADEYGSLPDLNVSREIQDAVAAWLTKTLPAPRR